VQEMVALLYRLLGADRVNGEARCSSLESPRARVVIVDDDKLTAENGAGGDMRDHL